MAEKQQGCETICQNCETEFRDVPHLISHQQSHCLVVTCPHCNTEHELKYQGVTFAERCFLMRQYDEGL